MARTTISVEVRGLDVAERLPAELARGQRRFVQGTLKALAASVAAVAPGGPTGSVGRSIKGRMTSDQGGTISSSHPGAKALDRGAFIQPKRKRALRFVVGGETVFVTRVRLPARNYFRRGLAPSGRIARAEFGRVFNDLEAGR